VSREQLSVSSEHVTVRGRYALEQPRDTRNSQRCGEGPADDEDVEAVVE
jgi:hypothetical protein